MIYPSKVSNPPPLYTPVFITHFFSTFRYEWRIRIGLFIKRNNKNMRLVVFYCINSSCPFKLNDEKRLAHRIYRLLVDGELCGGSEFEPHLDLAALYNWCVFDECWLTIQSTFVMGLAGWRKMCWVSTFSFRDSEKALAFSLSPYDPKSVNRAKNDAKRCKIQLTFQKYTSWNDSINNKRVI